MEEPGHTLARGAFLGCPRCAEFCEAKGNPAHETEAMEERILRGVAAMLASAKREMTGPGPSVGNYTYAIENDEQYAARLISKALDAAFPKEPPHE